ncbi:MAG: hypothetical protein WAM92_09640 [Mycobacterium sp.]
MRHLAILAATAVLATACSDSVVVDTGEAPPRTETATPSTPTGRSDPNLVDASDYYVNADGLKGYYFTTPSGKWNCAILPHSQAGCQATSGALGVPGEPDTVQTGDGEAVEPNAIAVGDDGDPGFTWLARPGFSVKSGKPLVLDLGKTLAAAGFRCNAQETGVSCLNEGTRKGFTFSSGGYVAQYTAVPA